MRAQARADAGKMLLTVRTFVAPPQLPMKPERAQELAWASESNEVASQTQRESLEVRCASCPVDALVKVFWMLVVDSHSLSFAGTEDPFCLWGQLQGTAALLVLPCRPYLPDHDLPSCTKVIAALMHALS